MGANVKVLIVEDDRSVRNLIAALFSLEHGWETTAAANAVDAYTAVAAGRFDVMVLDLACPGEKAGWKLLETFSGVLPTVVVSGHVDSPRLQDRALRMGARVVIAKPFDNRCLCLAVAMAAGR
jgi:two-component system OmpR family response regulator